jgi:tRNA pseudouridine38-40 synthase
MRPGFHARFSARSRRYSYSIGTDDCSNSPFRRRWEWSVRRPLSRERLEQAATRLTGSQCFRAFAVRGTAPAEDDHCCLVSYAAWRERAGGLVFEIEADRFLHHMVRFLIGTMIEIAAGRRPPDDLDALLNAPDNSATSPPAPAHGLFLDAVRYPDELYMTDSDTLPTEP